MMAAKINSLHQKKSRFMNRFWTAVFGEFVLIGKNTDIYQFKVELNRHDEHN
jgi:hypothetical protein